MNRDQYKEHIKQVDAWLKKMPHDLPADQLVLLFEQALTVLQIRVLKTLSEVTLHAILDRVLYQTQQKFPFFAVVKIDSARIDLKELLSGPNKLHPTDVTEAFRFFFIELFTVLENLTAGLLIEPLYEELFQITSVPKFPEDT